MRTEPPPSLAVARGMTPPAIAAAEPPQPRRGKAVWLATAAIVILGLGAVAYGLISSSDEEVTTSPLAAPEPPATVPSPPAPEPEAEPTTAESDVSDLTNTADEGGEASEGEPVNAPTPAASAPVRPPAKHTRPRPTPRSTAARPRPTGTSSATESGQGNANKKPAAKKPSGDDLFLNPYR